MYRALSLLGAGLENCSDSEWEAFPHPLPVCPCPPDVRRSEHELIWSLTATYIAAIAGLFDFLTMPSIRLIHE